MVRECLGSVLDPRGLESKTLAVLQGDDPELDAIRQRRMQEIMAQQGGKVMPGT